MKAQGWRVQLTCSEIFGELLRMSQEEFGFTSDGRITLPCDAAVMEYVMCMSSQFVAPEDTQRFTLFVRHFACLIQYDVK